MNTPLPTTAKEIEALGWGRPDVILFSGDAYVDHPSFGAAMVGRLLESQGLRVAIVPQPNWRDDLRDFRKLGRPRLFFAVSGGSMDSMVNHYTAGKRLRSDDAYTPGGKAGFRPDRAVSTYTKILKTIYPDVPVVIGGIEASLRRLTHYDYWSDSLRPSELIESGADLLIYGMGEKALPELARAMKGGFNLNILRKLPQTAFLADKSYVDAHCGDAVRLNSYESCLQDKQKFADNFKAIEAESNKMEARTIVEPAVGKFVVVNPPYPPLTEKEMDDAFALPFTRLPHPRYRGKGDIPAFEMIKFSINIHRGCFGGCSFCTISAHQGKFISSRSERSILDEVKTVTQSEGFKGYLSDIGGPSANMYRMGGRDTDQCRRCARHSCIWPGVCANLDNDHRPLMELYEKIRNVPGIKKAFIGSGIRYDIFDRHGKEYLRRVIQHHTSGRLKVAPEHTEEEVLKLMRKPSFDSFRELNHNFASICRELDVNYQLVPYFISGHPGCTEKDMKNLAQKTHGLHLEQVQDFTPTPMTLSSVIFYTGFDPYSGKKVYVARSREEKNRQKEYFFGKAGTGKSGNPGRSYEPKKIGTSGATDKFGNTDPSKKYGKSGKPGDSRVSGKPYKPAGKK